MFTIYKIYIAIMYMRTIYIHFYMNFLILSIPLLVYSNKKSITWWTEQILGCINITCTFVCGSVRNPPAHSHLHTQSKFTFEDKWKMLLCFFRRLDSLDSRYFRRLIRAAMSKLSGFKLNNGKFCIQNFSMTLI